MFSREKIVKNWVDFSKSKIQIFISKNWPKNFRISKSKLFWSKIIKFEYRFSEFQNQNFLGQKWKKIQKNFRIPKSKFFWPKIIKIEYRLILSSDILSSIFENFWTIFGQKNLDFLKFWKSVLNFDNFWPEKFGFRNSETFWTIFGQKTWVLEFWKSVLNFDNFWPEKFGFWNSEIFWNTFGY